jgi:hypothetical protein
MDTIKAAQVTVGGWERAGVSGTDAVSGYGFSRVPQLGWTQQSAPHGILTCGSFAGLVDHRGL